jgi:hypothetical protein
MLAPRATPLFAGAICALLSSATLAASPCDTLAAHPLDETKPSSVQGVAFGEIPVIRAVEACRAALRADPNNARYKFQLARAYHAAKEFGRARHYYALAAKDEHLLAIANLGYMLLHEQGSSGKTEDGIKLLKYAALRGVADAQFALGYAYATGLHIKRNLILAYAFFSLTRDAYPKKSERARKGLYDKMTASDIATANALAKRIADSVNEKKAAKGLGAKKYTGRSAPNREEAKATIRRPKDKTSGKTDQIQFAGEPRGNSLSARDLFRKVSKSIYVIYAGQYKNGTWKTTGGSAVAISPYRLLTNCHVIVKANVILAVQKHRRVLAAYLTGDMESDRCILFTADPMPVWSKVRKFDGLEIGERVYAIGAPRSLEMSLSDGLISSKRRRNGVQYIQTTAPISKGSSGGGLFDQWGNLIGITTFAVKSSQNLNFAIAAEEFAKQ